MSARQRLLDAADYLERCGWLQGEYGDAPEGPRCAIGALSAVSDEADPLYDKAYRALRSVVGPVADWNDERGRTVDDVVSAMRKAAWTC